MAKPPDRPKLGRAGAILEPPPNIPELDGRFMLGCRPLVVREGVDLDRFPTPEVRGPVLERVGAVLRETLVARVGFARGRLTMPEGERGTVLVSVGPLSGRATVGALVGGTRVTPPVRVGGNRVTAPVCVGGTRAAAPVRVGGNRFTAPVRVGGKRFTAPVRVGGNRVTAPVRVGGKRFTAPVRVGGNRVTAPVRVGARFTVAARVGTRPTVVFRP